MRAVPEMKLTLTGMEWHGLAGPGGRRRASRPINPKLTEARRGLCGRNGSRKADGRHGRTGADHTNRGTLSISRPGPRIFRIVVIKLELAKQMVPTQHIAYQTRPERLSESDGVKKRFSGGWCQS